MESTESHSQIMLVLGKLERSVEGVNHRLDVSNHSLEKHEMRLSNIDVLNAQMTITQQQLVTDIKDLKTTERSNNEFILTSRGSINTFKWLFGLVGVGTLINLLKVLGLLGNIGIK